MQAGRILSDRESSTTRGRFCSHGLRLRVRPALRKLGRSKELCATLYEERLVRLRSRSLSCAAPCPDTLRLLSAPQKKARPLCHQTLIPVMSKTVPFLGSGLFPGFFRQLTRSDAWRKKGQRTFCSFPMPALFVTCRSRDKRPSPSERYPCRFRTPDTQCPHPEANL